MKQNNKKHILARYALVVGIMLMFSAAIVWDLFKTTVVYAAEWNDKADKVLTDTTAIAPERGQLLADNGTVLAANLQYYIPRIDWFSRTAVRYLMRPRPSRPMASPAARTAPTNCSRGCLPTTSMSACAVSRS